MSLTTSLERITHTNKREKTTITYMACFKLHIRYELHHPHHSITLLYPFGRALLPSDHTFFLGDHKNVVLKITNIAQQLSCIKGLCSIGYISMDYFMLTKNSLIKNPNSQIIFQNPLEISKKKAKKHCRDPDDVEFDKIGMLNHVNLLARGSTETNKPKVNVYINMKYIKYNKKRQVYNGPRVVKFISAKSKKFWVKNDF